MPITRQPQITSLTHQGKNPSSLFHTQPTRNSKASKNKTSSTATRKAWIVAASIGAVEALKNQGISRWNYSIMSLQQHAKNNFRSFTESNTMLSSFASSSSSSSSSCSSSSTAVSNDIIRNAKIKKRQESLEKAMDLSCWGPSTTRF